MGSTALLIAQAVERRTCLAWPKRSTPVDNWVEHIPFGMFLVDVLRPRMLVELGVHYGDSYCAFCQAVAESGSPTRCYGIDHFKGDEHAGLYGTDVLADLRAHHDPLYGTFSRIIESTFDGALRQFEDGSIDLLHIDGLHTYEAIRGDFEAWRPKVSDVGVVIMHDVNVREREFGVWKLWEELSAKHPHFEFLHGHGLGVLAVGEPPAAIRPLFEAKENEVATIRAFFFELGQRISLKRQTAKLAADRERAAGLETDLGVANKRVAGLETDLGVANKRVAGLEADLRDERRRRQFIESRTDLLSRKHHWLSQVHHDLHVRFSLLTGLTRSVLNSRSWRLTRPFRWMFGRAERSVPAERQLETLQTPGLASPISGPEPKDDAGADREDPPRASGALISDRPGSARGNPLSARG